MVKLRPSWSLLSPDPLLLLYHVDGHQIVVVLDEEGMPEQDRF